MPSEEIIEMADKDKKKNWFVRHKILTVIIALIFIGVAASAASGDGSNNTTDNDSTADTSTKTEDKKAEPTPVKEEKKPDVPAEYKSALSQSDSYANTMHLSKKGLYGQLTSEYGGQFTAEAAQYAIDNVKADWNANALAQAKTYQNDMHLSPAAVRDQLVSEHGGQFTAAEADYAIAHLND